MTYDVFYIDPPWAYRNKKTGGSHTSGAAQKYETLDLLTLGALPLREIAAPSSVCFLWGTTPFGGDPYTVLGNWGWSYKTEWYWHKIGRKGTGYWTRGCVEKLLIGIRGPVTAWRSSLDNWIEEGTDGEIFDGVFTSKPEGHSHKPARVRQMIELLTTGAARRLELFATEIPTGWDAYGLELSPTHDVRNPEFWEMLKAK